MQKIATKIFIFSSLVFGVLGISLVLLACNDTDSILNVIIQRSFAISVFIILPSFALSVAGKYLMDNKENR